VSARSAALSRCIDNDAHKNASIEHNPRAGQHRGLGVHISFVRSVTMDSWKDDELRRMQLGGNGQLNDFLAMYDVPKETPIKDKYNTPAAGFFRELIRAQARGEAYSPPPPSPDNMGVRQPAPSAPPPPLGGQWAGNDPSSGLGAVSSEPWNEHGAGGTKLDDLSTHLHKGLSLGWWAVSQGATMAAQAAKTGLEHGRRIAQEKQLDQRAKEIGQSAAALGMQGWGYLKSFAKTAASSLRELASDGQGDGRGAPSHGWQQAGRPLAAEYDDEGHGGGGHGVAHSASDRDVGGATFGSHQDPSTRAFASAQSEGGFEGFEEREVFVPSRLQQATGAHSSGDLHSGGTGQGAPARGPGQDLLSGPGAGTKPGGNANWGQGGDDDWGKW